MNKTNTIIHVDNSGLVVIKGEDINAWIAEKIVKAIARGFNPEIALLLANENYDLDIIDITKYAHTKNALIRLRGRVIGQEGRSRKFIEKHTKTYISVYGKTISIIGTYENLSTARRAIIMLLEGAKHPRMYGFLEDLKKKR